MTPEESLIAALHDIYDGLAIASRRDAHIGASDTYISRALRSRETLLDDKAEAAIETIARALDGRKRNR